MNIFRYLPITFEAFQHLTKNIKLFSVKFMNIYLSNLHFSITEDEIEQLFQQFGMVSSINLIVDKKTKKSKGYAFVEMPSDTEAELAIKNCNAKEVRGRTLKVSQAKK